MNDNQVNEQVVKPFMKIYAFMAAIILTIFVVMWILIMREVQIHEERKLDFFERCERACAMDRLAEIDTMKSICRCLENP